MKKDGENKRNEALDLLYDISNQEYKLELDRAKSLDSKSGIAITLISGYLMAILSSFNNFVDVLLRWEYSSANYVIFIFSFVAAIVFCVVSLLCMLNVIKLRQYKTLKPEIYYCDDFIASRESLELQVLTSCFNARGVNKMRNDDRANSFDMSLTFFIVSLMLYLLYIVFYSIIERR